MISRSPALELLHALVGSWRDPDGTVTIELRSCGHGVGLDIGRGGRSALSGVVGVCGDGVECFALVGLPRVVRLVGALSSDDELVLVAEEPVLAVHLVRRGAELELCWSIDRQPKATHLLRKAPPGQNSSSSSPIKG